MSVLSAGANSVQEIVTHAVIGDWDIPELQRGFVWNPTDVAKLAESLYRDYPVGSFLLWEAPEYAQPRTDHGNQASTWIIDGQQRTTAMCLLFGKMPHYWDERHQPQWREMLKRYDVMIKIAPKDDEEPEFAIANPVRRRDPGWISVREVLSLRSTEELGKLASELAQQLLPETSEPTEIMQLYTRLHERLTELYHVRLRQIPVVRVDNEPEDVAEIFARINQEGTRVKEADVILALVSVHNPGWVRDEYTPFQSDLAERGWDLDAGVFVRTIVGIGAGRGRLRDVPTEFYKPETFMPAWQEAKRAIVGTLHRLGERGVLHSELLPSTNSLIPLFVLQAIRGKAPDYNFNKALHWLLLANRDGRYSGASVTALDQDIRAIHEAPSFEEALQRLYARLSTPEQIDAAEFLERFDRKGNRFQRTVLYLLLFHNGARDWVDGARIGYDKGTNALAEGFRPQYHHIFPRSVLKKLGRSDADISALANITVLTEESNCRRLQNKPPAQYLQEYVFVGEEGTSEEENRDKKSELLRQHAIPDEFVEAAAEPEKCSEVWDVSNYDEFIRARAELLAREANRLLEILRLGRVPEGR
ncbi:MAG: DUF262 domain-containing protein [Armatimonadetes bacterium]|nr:DUF262 domain-containing protein [Armatimonadota bacterium]